MGRLAGGPGPGEPPQPDDRKHERDVPVALAQVGPHGRLGEQVGSCEGDDADADHTDELDRHGDPGDATRQCARAGEGDGRDDVERRGDAGERERERGVVEAREMALLFDFRGPDVTCQEIVL